MKRTLSAENIDTAWREVETFLESTKTDRNEIIKIKLAVEEALLRFAEAFGSEAEFKLRMGKRFNRSKILISVPGETYDPFSAREDEDESSAFMRSMLTTIGQRPVWHYAFQTNTISFSTTKKAVPELLKIGLAIVLAIVCGLIVRTFPDSLKTLIQTGIFKPLLSTFLGFLNAIAGPMVFLAVVWGIYSMGDVNTFSTIGKKLTIRFAVYITCLTIVAGLLLMPFFNLNYGDGSSGGGFSSLYTMILDIVPDNLFTPFSTGNTLQILFVAIVIGISLIILGERTQNVALLSEQLNLIVQGIMKIISSLVPFYIFGSIFDIVLSSDFSTLSVAGSFFLGAVAAYVIIMLIQTVITSFGIKESPLSIWKKSFDSLLIAFTTASSSAAFSSNISTCEEKYGVDGKLANFAVPFTQILYKPGGSLMFFIATVSMAENNNMTVSVTWIISALVMSIILSAAAPPIPGGALASFSVLFLQLGVPTENLAVVLSVVGILDFFATACNIFCDQLLIVDESARKTQS